MKKAKEIKEMIQEGRKEKGEEPLRKWSINSPT